jgi:hypothetical protein
MIAVLVVRALRELKLQPPPADPALAKLKVE